MSEIEEINKILDDYKNKQGQIPQTEQQTQAQQSPMDIALLMSKTISSFTRIISPKVGLQSIAFTDDDEKNFYESLKPFNEQLMDFLKYMIYAPLIIFVAGYSMRIYVEYKAKKRIEKKEVEQKKNIIEEKNEDSKSNSEEKQNENNNEDIKEKKENEDKELPKDA